MKKWLFAFCLMLLAGCSSGEQEESQFTTDEAIPFEIAGYEQMIDPVYGSVVPHIAYAKTESQFESVKARFDMEHVDIDMNEFMALFIVTYSDGCGIAVDGVYDHNNNVSVQLLPGTGDSCDKEGVPHTFVLKVAQGDYEKVQLFNGNTIKSSMDIE
ncbi:MAG: Fe-S oxidoreductase [Solibacillus sp.]